MNYTPKLVLLTSEELDILIQSSIRQALGNQSPQSAVADDRPLSIEEASTFLKIPKATIYTYTSKRGIPFHKVGKNLIFFKRELLEWIEEGKKKTKKQIEAEGFVKLGKGGMKR